mgnify:CR=1
MSAQLSYTSRFFFSSVIFILPSFLLKTLQNLNLLNEQNFSQRILKFNLSVTLGGFLGLFVRNALSETLKHPEFISSRLYIVGFLFTFLFFFCVEKLSNKSKEFVTLALALIIHRLTESFAFGSLLQNSRSHLLLVSSIFFSETAHTINDYFSLVSLGASPQESVRFMMMVGCLGVIGLVLQGLLTETIRKFLLIVTMVVFLKLSFGQLSQGVFNSDEDEFEEDVSIFGVVDISSKTRDFLITVACISAGYLTTGFFQ